MWCGNYTAQIALGTVCIIKDMPPIKRPNKKTIMISDEEEALTELLAKHWGTDISSVFRQSLLRACREEGIVLPETKPKPRRQR
jgi:chaperone required for assembly of F1-ATPase